MFAHSEVELFDDALENVFGVGVQSEELHLSREVKQKVVVCSEPKKGGEGNPNRDTFSVLSSAPFC